MGETSDEAARRVGIVITRAGELSNATAQTDGMPRTVAIDEEHAGARALWMGRVTGEPGMNSQLHHHGEAESGGFVLSGNCRIYYGDDLQDSFELHPGDFCYIPPYLPHLESNPYDEPVEFVTVRSPSNIVVNLAPAERVRPA